MSTSSYAASLRFLAASSTHFPTSSYFRLGRVLPVMIPILSMVVSSAPERSVDAKLLTDPANLALPLAQRLGAGVHGVISEDEVMRMLRRRTEHEARLALGDEVDRLLRGLEDGDFTAGDGRRGPKHAFVHGDPRHRVSLGRMVAPPLAGLQADCEIGHRRRSNRALRIAIRAENHSHRPLVGYVFRHHVATGIGCVLQLRRQGHPKLEHLHAPLLGSAGVPDAVSGPHPLDAARREDTFVAGGLRVAD